MSPPSSKNSPDGREERLLVISFHDVAAHSWVMYDFLLSRLRAIGVDRVSLLVVPHWHNTGKIVDSPACVKWLRQMADDAHEICLHGFSHLAARSGHGLIHRLIGRVYTDGEGEFYELDEPDASARMAEGLALFREAGLRASGFVAPAWLLSGGSRHAARKAGFLFSPTLGHIELLQEERRIPAPVLACSCRRAWRRHLSMAWMQVWPALQFKRPIVRVAVHPLDLAYPAVKNKLLSTIELLARTRDTCTYGDIARMFSAAEVPNA